MRKRTAESQAPKRNDSGLALGDAVANMMYDNLMVPDDVRNPDGIYTQYQKEPVRFATEVFNESFTEDVEKVMRSVWDNPITVAISANAVGKTHGAARIAAAFYKVWPDSQVYTLAAPPESNLKLLLWGEIANVLSKHSQVFASDRVSVGGMSVSRAPEKPLSFIQGVAIPATGTDKEREARFSGKHAPQILFIADEGDAVPREVYSGIESCLSGGLARLLIMFNPRAEQGYPAELIKSRRANIVHLSAFSHPNVVSGIDVFPGAVTREVTVRRINEWTRSLLHGEIEDKDDTFEVPEFLVGATAVSFDGSTVYPPLQPGLRKISDPQFSYMVLGRYPSIAENQLIAREWINRARRNYDLYTVTKGIDPPRGVEKKQGVDVADSGYDLNCSCMRYDYFVPPLDLWAGVDTIVSGDRAISFYKQHRADEAYVDGTGVGAGVAPYMTRDGCIAHKIMVSSSATEECEEGQFDRLRDQGWWALREWLRKNPFACLPPDELLIEELLAPNYHKTRYGKIKISDNDFLRAKLRRSPDRGSALMLTFCPRPEDSAGEINVYNYIKDDNAKEEIEDGSYSFD